MSTKGLLIYLLTGFSFASLFAVYVHHHQYIIATPDDGEPPSSSGSSPYPLLSSSNSSNLPNHAHAYGSEAQAWPELEFNWRMILASVIGFFGSACGTVGGVGGGGIFVPMLTLVVGFDTKSAAAISKCMIMGASASSVWYNLRVPHPCREISITLY